jgi:ABC-2 type transport system ATP-binding protein
MKLAISNISKKYGKGHQVLDDISLEINAGMFGLLGPNGAGKSTLMRTLATLQIPDSGTIFLNDIDVVEEPHELRKQLGYLPQDFGVYPRVKARDLLLHIAWVKGLNDKKERENMVDYMLEQVNLSEHKYKILGAFSGGMKQRFGIAQALIANPKFLIVDEPTAGLDPVERNRFYNILSELGHDRIVLLSTHIVDDVKNLCQELAILHEGKIKAKAKPAEMEAALQGKVGSFTLSRDESDEAVASYQVLSKIFRDGAHHYRVYLGNTNESGMATICEPNLEDYYFAVINGYLHA